VLSFSECTNFLPIFSGKEEDNPAHHLVKFHQCIDQLDVYHEDALMKMFVYSLDGDAQKWYRLLPTSNISSLKEFHATFNKYCKRYYSTDTLLKDCCERFKSYIQQTVECSSCEELCEDLVEKEIKKELVLEENILDSYVQEELETEKDNQEIIEDESVPHNYQHIFNGFQNDMFPQGSGVDANK
jgi:hypothetical protein